MCIVKDVARDGVYLIFFFCARIETSSKARQSRAQMTSKRVERAFPVGLARVYRVSETRYSRDGRKNSAFDALFLARARSDGWSPSDAGIRLRNAKTVPVLHPFTVH